MVEPDNFLHIRRSERRDFRWSRSTLLYRSRAVLIKGNRDDATPKIAEAWLACARCSFCSLDLRLLAIPRGLCRKSESHSSSASGFTSDPGIGSAPRNVLHDQCRPRKTGSLTGAGARCYSSRLAKV